jgi:hypothetical protein
MVTRIPRSTLQAHTVRLALCKTLCAAGFLQLVTSAAGAHAQTPAPPAPPPAPSASVQGAGPTKSEPPPCEPCGDPGGDGEGAGMFLVGAGVFDLSELNDHLRANGYETFGSVITLLGGQGRVVLDSGFVIGGHGAALIAPSGDSSTDFQTSLGGGFGMFDLGFALVHTHSILFTITGGIGGYGLSLEIDDERSARFDEVLQNPGRSTTLSAGGLLVGASIGLDARVSIGKPDKGRRGFFTLGARLGGLFGPPIGSWSLPNADVRGGPSTQLVGAHASLALGFGGGPAR